MLNPTDFFSCKNAFQTLNVNLTNDQYQKLTIFQQMMTEELKIQNISTIKDPDEIWIRHFLDSAVLLDYLPQHARVLDMGTGGGIPAIPLAILNPSLNITMLDSELRKVEFCNKVIDKLQLNSITLCGRAEEICKQEQYYEKYDYVVSRAMAAGSMLMELSCQYLKVGGFLISMKGKNYDAQTERFAQASEKLGFTVESTIPYVLDEENKFLIIAKKHSHTEEIYPRRFAKIKRSPL
ncbi:MAG: 16S rRNA (guanine(527)-N(7))-methyltransferase RsmG [Oscillospiraceae bacterium]|nr:16S rRNA (guanine(527)-N(7))-methyltransferase RsmG [Oscillospiraceae bacterium]